MSVTIEKSSTTDFINQLVDKFEPKMKKIFIDAIATIKSNLSLSKIADLLQRGRTEEALKEITDQYVKMANNFIQFILVAGNATAKIIESKMGIAVSFDHVNYGAVQVMKASQLRLIREMTAQQAQATRQALINGIRAGNNPVAQALAFRDSIGLTAMQQDAVDNYRKLLETNSSDALNRALRDRRFDPTVQNAIDEEVALTRGQIDRMVERYRDRYINYRSEVIARTEALRAAYKGAYAMFQQAIDDGSLNPDDLTQTWRTAEDERVRESHADMDGQQQAIGDPFISGNGVELMYPGDENAPADEIVQCRCIVTTVFSVDVTDNTPAVDDTTDDTTDDTSEDDNTNQEDTDNGED